jgi:hypothetical protein
MNFIEFNQVGGFPLTTNVLNKLQTAFTLFNALGNIVGNLTIISGCEVAGNNVANGAVFINGEVLEFRGGLAQSKVIIKEDTENLAFQNGNSYPVIKTRYVTFGTGVGAINWSDFKRGFQTKDLFDAFAKKADGSIVTAIADAVALIITKLNTIETGAEKNVQANLNQTDNTKADFVKGKTSIGNPFLLKGVLTIGDVSGNGGSIHTANFPSVGTSNYLVVGSLVSKGSNWDQDNDVMWIIREKTEVSFKVAVREVASVIQNLDFEYMLIPL